VGGADVVGEGDVVGVGDGVGEGEGVGVDTWPINTPGWRSPAGLYLDDPLEGFGLSAEDSATLHVGGLSGAARVPRE
jgi:hypothetical protein